MSRGRQLQQIVSDLRAEVGDTTSVTQGQNALARYQTMVRRTQEWLYSDFDWPFLLVDRDVSLTAGTRYYNFHADINFNRIREAFVLYSECWRTMEYGISPHDYNVHDSDSDDRLDPPSKWRHYESSQFEVWPIPASNDVDVRFRGIKNLSALVDDSDTADLDDRLIILYAASELLTVSNPAAAEIKLKLANQLYLRLKGQTQKQELIVMGGGLESWTPRPPRFTGAKLQ